MGDGEEPVFVEDQEITTRAAALAHADQGPGSSGLVPPDAPADARERVRGSAEKIWRVGGLPDNGGTFVVTPEGIQKAVSICQEGVEHANYAMNESEKAKSFLAAMFGSCAQGQVYARTVSAWMDTMGEKATALQAILNGVSDGTQEIKTKAEQTDSAWACSFQKLKTQAVDIGARVGGSL